jgi:hypothetical protein
MDLPFTLEDQRTTNPENAKTNREGERFWLICGMKTAQLESGWVD